ncbi:MAG TPA: phosphotransferase [Candidatus Limnocylindrales bacterium]|nr:phosphotransferase [Candidatus Limnocylindrales bacterium]
MPLQSLGLDKKALGDIAAEYGLGKIGPTSAAIPEWGSKRYILEVSKTNYELQVRSLEDEFDLRRELELLMFLEKHSFPSPRPVSDRRGRQFIEREGHYLVLYKMPLGKQAVGDQLSLKAVHSMGRVLGQLHMVGRGYKKAIDNRFGFDRIFEAYAAVRRRIPPYFKKIIRTLDEETEYLGNYLETKLPKGIIHGTVHCYGILVRGDQVVCLGDFDAACRGKYVFDLATAVNAMCFVEGGYSLERFEALMAGYESLRTLSLAEWDSFPNELRFAALRFAVTRLCEFFEGEPDEQNRINTDFREYLDRLRVLRREKEGGMEGLLMAMATGYDYRKYQRVKSGDYEGDEEGAEDMVGEAEEAEDLEEDIGGDDFDEIDDNED